jgi:hypothetical protein
MIPSASQARAIDSVAGFFDTEERRHGAHGEDFDSPIDAPTDSTERRSSRINPLSVISVLFVSVSKITRTNTCAAGKA